MASARDLLARTPTVASAKDALASAMNALEGLIALAFTDPTTSLYNRRALDEVTKLPLGYEFTFAVLMIDLTSFKRINDESSHAAGDAALGRVGSTIAALCTGDFDDALSFRYGGDEFCILVPQAKFAAFIEPTNLSKLSWRDFAVEDEKFGFGASIGIADPDDTVGLVQLIARADVAAKASKQRGDEPVRWSPSIEGDAMAGLRKRCDSCAATITLSVARERLVDGGFKSCPNCGGALR